jgi:hypothetical protein
MTLRKCMYRWLKPWCLSIDHYVRKSNTLNLFHKGKYLYHYIFFLNSVLLCSPVWLQTHDPPASTSQVLGLQVWATMLYLYLKNILLPVDSPHFPQCACISIGHLRNSRNWSLQQMLLSQGKTWALTESGEAFYTSSPILVCTMAPNTCQVFRSQYGWLIDWLVQSGRGDSQKSSALKKKKKSLVTSSSHM